MESEWWQGLSIGRGRGRGRDEGSSNNSRHRPGASASLGRGSSYFPSGLYLWKTVYNGLVQRMAWLDGKLVQHPLKYEVQYEGLHEGRGSSSPNDPIDADRIPINVDRTSISASGFEQLQGPLLGTVYVSR